MDTLFLEGLKENDINKLLVAPKSNLHNQPKDAGENVQPFEAFLPLYRKAEKYHLTKKMHVGETGSAEDVRRGIV